MRATIPVTGEPQDFHNYCLPKQRLFAKRFHQGCPQGNRSLPRRVRPRLGDAFLSGSNASIDERPVEIDEIRGVDRAVRNTAAQSLMRGVDGSYQCVEAIAVLPNLSLACFMPQRLWTLPTGWLFLERGNGEVQHHFKWTVVVSKSAVNSAHCRHVR
jgi:hypothetical protein